MLAWTSMAQTSVARTSVANILMISRVYTITVVRWYARYAACNRWGHGRQQEKKK